MGSSTISALVTRGDAHGGGDDIQIFLSNFGPEPGASPKPWPPAARNVTVRLAAPAGVQENDGANGSWRWGLGLRSPSVVAGAVPTSDAPHDPRLVRRWPSSALLRRIDDASTAPLSAWERQGAPDYPTPGQIAQLHAASEMPTSSVEISVDAGSGDAILTVELPPYGVAHVSIPLPAGEATPF